MADGEESRYFEYIVVGCGGIGSAAVYWLAKRAGKGVLGLEQFHLGHDHGGSQDHSRIIRLTYHDVKYTALTPATYETWKEVEDESGHQLVHNTGIVDLFWRGTKSEEYLEATIKALSQQNLPFERWDVTQLRKRFPQFTPGNNVVALYEPKGGLVDAALANSIHVQLARAHGATIQEHCAVTRIDTHPDDTATVVTTKGVFRCRRVIITAGAWTNRVLGSLGMHVPLKITQEQCTFFATPHPKKFSKANFPVFRAHQPEGYCNFYGFPTHVNSGSKIGQDASGRTVTPETRSYTPDRLLVDRATEWLKHNIPEFLGPEMYTKTCLYAMTLDRDFVIDSLAKRGKPQVILCMGAGHAFKFASLFGKILSEMAMRGQTDYPISAFTLDRPAITDPDFIPVARTGRHPEDNPNIMTHAKL